MSARGRQAREPSTTTASATTRRLLGLAWAAWASLVLGTNAEAQALPEVNQCVARLDPAVDVGYERIAARCPELARALEQGEWAAWLPRGWNESGNDLSAGSLTELREVVRRESAVAPHGRSPEVQHLRSVVDAMGVGVASEGAW